ncbi:MAG TPA: peptidyl-prolyl cis-trans isomerase [Phycisphaerae bacterium]|nr:peptidyl-prolyl cis-trans isomerase [Phycisphaerae bacterium]
MKTRLMAARWAALAGAAFGASVSVAAEPTAATSSPSGSAPATAPATQPESEIILFRVGDKAVVTQEDFTAAVQLLKPEQYDAQAMSIVRRLLEQKLFELYLADHPELIPPAKLEAEIERRMKNAKIATLDEVKKRFAEKGFSFEAYGEDLRVRLARAELIRRGSAIGEDTAALKKIYDQHPTEFDGTTVDTRQIMLVVAPTDTPAVRAEKKSRLVKMREDILAGKRTWDQCVSESDFRNPNGSLGAFTRHGMVHEMIAKAAFALEVGQFSDIIETPLGYHLLHVTARKPGNRPFEELQIQRNMRVYFSGAKYQEAIAESFLKHPVVGVQPPRRPAKIGSAIKPSAPSYADLERMLSTRPAATRPAGAATRGAAAQPARPGATLRPATRSAMRPAPKPATGPAPKPPLPAKPPAR